MKTTTYSNRTSISFNLKGKGDAFVNNINKIYAIAQKHNAQANLFTNESHLKHDKNGNLIGEKMGDIGGTITFHAHSCEHGAAANELIAELEQMGMKNETYSENIKNTQSGRDAL